MKKRSFLLLMALLVLTSFMTLSGCKGKESAVPFAEVNRRNAESDLCFSEHAGKYTEQFTKDYPDMAITKVRWQVIFDGTETYIIEGNNKTQKSIVKYLVGDDIVLARVERDFLEEEIVDGNCIEKELVFLDILTYTELCDVTKAELGGKLQEMRLVWKEEIPTVYAEVIFENGMVKGVTLDAVTGDILY